MNLSLTSGHPSVDTVTGAPSDGFMSQHVETLPAPESAVPILGSSSGGLCYELVRSASGEFVLLHEGRYSRVYLGRIAFGTGNEVTPFALKVQSDGYQFPPEGAGGVTNPDIDDAWRREREDLTASASPNVVSSLPLPATASRPVAFCKQTGRYFHPICPDTGRLLRVCKDDDLLRDAKLEMYGASLRRYLYAGGDGGPGRTFYRRSGLGDRARGDARVKTEVDLVRAWGPVVRGENAVTAAPGFACAGCPHVATCYAKERDCQGALDNLVWVSFYDFEMIAFGLLDLKYDEACDLVGGEDWLRIFERVQNNASGAGRKDRLEAWTGAFEAPNQWMFRDDPDKFALEVLRLKLMMFSEVVEGVRAVHGCDRPHFGVAPDNLMAKVLPGNIGMPARWNMRVQLIDLGSPLRFRPVGVEAGDAPAILQPGSDLRGDVDGRRYVSPMVTEPVHANMSLTVKAVAPAADRIRVELEGGAGGLGELRKFAPEDVVYVLPSAGGGAGLWGRIAGIGRGKVQIEALLPRGADGRGFDVGRVFVASLHFYKNYGNPVDLYGLGMVLLRTLLVNDGQDMDRVDRWVRNCLDRLNADMGSGTADVAFVRARLGRIMISGDLHSVPDASNVLFKEGDRRRARSVPKDIWDEVLFFAFRLLTQVDGFSYAARHSRGAPMLLKQVVADLNQFLLRLHIETFSADLRARELGQACRDFAQVLRRDLMDGVASTPGGNRSVGTGVMLHVQREGSAEAPQAFGPFEDKVVIGRKEGNEVCLGAGKNDEVRKHISSTHAVIERSTAGWLIRDVSQNGTRVGSEVLPRDVPQPLRAGAVIRIPASTDGAYLVRFQPQGEDLNETIVMQPTANVYQQLMSCYVREMAKPADERLHALRQVLARCRTDIPDTTLLVEVEKLCNSFTPGGGGAAAPVGPDVVDLAAAHRAVAEVARELLGPQPLERQEDIKVFVGQLSGFVTTTVEWFLKTRELIRTIYEEVEAPTSSTTTGVSRPQDPGDVFRKVLDWQDARVAQGAGLDWLRTELERVYTAVTAGQRAVKNVLAELKAALSPAAIELEARQRHLRFLVNVAAKSSLWKTYQDAFGKVLDPSFVVRVLEPAMRKGYRHE